MLSMNVSAPALVAAKASFTGVAPTARPAARLSAKPRAVATQALFGKKEPKQATKTAAKATEKYNGPMVCLECGYIATAQAYSFPLYRCGSCFAGKNRFEPAEPAKKKKGLFGR